MTDRPIRVQLSRRKGWKMPPNTVGVARPGKWGNWHRIGKPYDARPIPHTADEAVVEFRADLITMMRDDPVLFRTWIAPLRGKNLACWCPLDQPCHADVLLEIAND